MVTPQIDHQPDGRPLTAVLYLRVSTKEQAERGGDAEGFSIPAQRSAATRKAESLGATVAAEFVDRGESARSANRPELQKLLAYITEHPTNFVIVHKVDRLARNRADDVQINLALQAAGVTLVSVSENIDETPSGALLHGIMSSIAEFYSRNLSHEIKTKTLQKVQAGGTPNLAPIGYLNGRQKIDGQEIKTIEIDPVRGPLLRWAFEAYDTGDYSLRQLADELEAMGLTQRATRRQPERTIGANRLQQILRRRYYIGYVTYRGVEYQGRHEPLISEALFERVQQRLDSNRHAKSRSYKRDHYLKGTVFCARCESRLLYFVSTGNGGKYEYFRCSGRHNGRTECSLPHLPAQEVELGVTEAWRGEQISRSNLETLRAALDADLAGYTDRADAERQRLTTRLRQLEGQRRKWAEKAMNDVVPDDIARERQQELARQIAWTQTELDKLTVDEDELRANIDLALRLAQDCHGSYTRSKGQVRRMWNQAWFESVLVDVEDDKTIVIADKNRTDIADAVRHDSELVNTGRPPSATNQPPTEPRSVERSNRLDSPHHNRRSHRNPCFDHGSNFKLLVETMGLEPTTPCLQSRCSSQLSYVPGTDGCRSLRAALVRSRTNSTRPLRPDHRRRGGTRAGQVRRRSTDHTPRTRWRSRT